MTMPCAPFSGAFPSIWQSFYRARNAPRVEVRAQYGQCAHAYAYPAPDGYASAPIQPREAFFSEEFGEFLLPYETVRTAPDPEAKLMAFLQSTYDAAADLGGWDRSELECPYGTPYRPRLVEMI